MYSNSGWRVNVQQLRLEGPSWGMTEEDSSSNYRRGEDRNSKISPKSQNDFPLQQFPPWDTGNAGFNKRG